MTLRPRRGPTTQGVDVMLCRVQPREGSWKFEEMVLAQGERGTSQRHLSGSPASFEGILAHEFGMEPVCLVGRLWLFPAAGPHITGGWSCAKSLGLTGGAWGR